MWKVGEGVCAAQLIHRRVGQRDVVPSGESKHHLGFESALDVDVQFRLRQGQKLGIVHDVHPARRVITAAARTGTRPPVGA